GIHRLLDRDGTVLLVQPEQIDRVDAEPFQAAGERVADGAGRQPRAMLRPGAGPERLGTELRGDAHTTRGVRTGCQPAAEHGLGGAAVTGRTRPEAVAVGGVDPDAAALDEAIEQGERGVLVDERPEGHRPEDE